MSNKTKLLIDEEIKNIDKVICRHIDNLAKAERGVVSQDILAQLRNFVEHIMVKVYGKGKDIRADWSTIPEAEK
jgi:hypothetical protein